MSGARDETEKSMSWTEAVAGALGSHEVSLRANAVSQLLQLTKVVQQARQAAAAPAAAASSGDELDRVINLIENLYEHIDRLKKDVAELNNTHLRDGGTWNAKTLYRANDVVTCDGTLWLCRQPNANSHPPGDSWRLMVKVKGRP
jgi:hypothetical protein